MVKAGIINEKEVMVTSANTAEALHSGVLPVFGTPALIALMEAAAAESVQTELPEGMTSVGTRLDVRHTAATPVGMKVTCRSTLVEVDDRRLVFKVEAFDECSRIGEGLHERFMVKGDRFLQKANQKLA